MRKQFLAGGALLAAALGISAPAAVMAEYPDKPIRVIIGFSPGGPTDAIGRVLFKRVSEELKVPMVIENRPGAGGNIGSQDLAKSAPDGYTIMYGTSSITTAPPLFGRDDLNPTTIFDAVSCTTEVPLILLAGKKVPVKSANELYAQIEKNPGQYFMGSSGNGSIDHLTGMEVAGVKKLNFQHVPYKGNGPALTDLAGGNIDFMYSGSFNSARPFLERGDVHALAVTSAKRSAALPDVPTLSESAEGLKGFSGGTWQVVLTPKGTSQAIIERLGKAVDVALKDPKVLESLTFQGATVMDQNQNECQAFIASEYDRWSSKIKELKLAQGQ